MTYNLRSSKRNPLLSKTPKTSTTRRKEKNEKNKENIINLNLNSLNLNSNLTHDKQKSPFTPQTNEELRTAVKKYRDMTSDERKDYSNHWVYGKFNDWDVSKIKDMSELFKDLDTFDEELNSWDVSNVKNMKYMFKGCKKFNQKLNSWKVGNVVTMESMIDGCESFNQELNSWDVSKVENMRFMFKGCKKFNQELNSWKVGNVVTMESMIDGCESFNQELKSWDVSKVENMRFMFKGCKKFNQELNSWNVRNVVTMESMFDECESFNQELNSWDVSKVTNMRFMFKSCRSFNQKLNSWKVGNVTNMDSMFDECESFNQELNSWDVSKVENMRFMFNGCESFNQELNAWDVSNVENMTAMFGACKSFNQELNSWNVGNVTNMESMFESCITFEGNIYDWDVTQVENMNNMFFDCVKFNARFLQWQLDNLKTWTGMFSGNNTDHGNIQKAIFKRFPDLKLFDFQLQQSMVLNFPVPLYKVSISDLWDEVSIYYHDINKNNSANSRCMYLTFDHENKLMNLEYLKYEQPNICKINGTELLFLLYKVARDIKYNINIGTDASSKSYGKCKINFLAHYDILKTGKSYYNKFGYGDIGDNEKIRNMEIKDIVKQESIADFITVINDLHPDGKISMNSSLKYTMEVLDKVLRSFEIKQNKSQSDEEIVCRITKVINYIINAVINKITYDNSDLVLDINDPDTIQFYKDLEQKLRLTTQGGYGKKNTPGPKSTLRKMKKVNKKINKSTSRRRA